MSLFDVTSLLIAIGLSMDSFAVSIGIGAVRSKGYGFLIFLVSLSFAMFQAAMLILGWSAGLSIERAISYIDHWIAFGLLGFIGIRMIYESASQKETSREYPLTIKRIFLLSFATSVDAFVIGISLAFFKGSIFISAAYVLFVTFLFSTAGIFVGRGFRRIFYCRAGIIGGMILIGIGAKILIEHLS